MKKVFLLILVAIFVVFGIDVFFNYTLRNAPWGLYKKFNTIIESNQKFNVWILGSSRAETAFETNVLSQKFHQTFFNAGIHGSKPQQTYYVFKHIISQHHLPELIIMDVDIHNISDEDTILNIEQFAPFLRHSQLRNDLSKIDKRIQWAYYNPLYEMSFWGLRGISKITRVLINQPGRYDTTFQASGCYHSHTDFQKEHYPDTTHPFIFHPTNTQYLDSIILLSIKNNIPVIFSISPVFQPDSNIFNASKKLKEFCDKRNITLIDCSNISYLSFDKTKFSDKYHLKFNGSIEFTNIFADSLMKYYNLQKAYTDN